MHPSVPATRLVELNRKPIRSDGEFVVYWMSWARRTSWNFGLDRAIHHALELKIPLVVVETLACDSPWMNPRHASFVLDGMADNEASFRKARISYLPCVAADSARLRSVLTGLAARAAAIVADHAPLREPAAFSGEIAASSPVLVEQVDSHGLLPLSATDRAFPTAHGFRRFLQRNLPSHLTDLPTASPRLPTRHPQLKDVGLKVPKSCRAGLGEVMEHGVTMAARHGAQGDVAPVDLRGGTKAGRRVLQRFGDERLTRYGSERNQPESNVASGLSPYLHHGQIAVHEVFADLAERQQWSPDRLSDRVSGSREGWWGMDPSVEAFLDELVTWREVGFNMCAHRDDYDRPESLPDWAQATLDAHAGDRRTYEYSLEEFRDGLTHDELWNAAQGQLLREGIIHNYLRMLWGKKILEWTSDWQTALETMTALNNTYALDGCDPNSYSGIFWVLGRYDRAWGPERPVFGKIRYMSSENTARKVRVRRYIEQYAPTTGRRS